MTNDETGKRTAVKRGVAVIKRVAIATGILLLVVVQVWQVLPLRSLGIGWLRYHSINKILDKYNMTARANLMPSRKIFDAAAVGGHTVDIGYAKFAVNEEEAPTSIRVKGDTGTAVVVECKDFQIAFLNPSQPTPMDDNSRHTMESGKQAYPKMAAFMQEMCSDEVAAGIEAEKTRPATFAEARAMTMDDYLVYNQKLEMKIATASGMDEVFWFENAQTKGIAEIGKKAGDRTKGHILLSSSDGGKLVGCLVAVQDGKQGDAGKMIGQIAASFVFTIDNIADQEEIKRRIAKAGIAR